MAYVTVLDATDHAHQWEPFTKWKARCRRCGRHTPWTDIVKEYKTVVQALRVHSKK